MKTGFVETENVRRFHACLGALERRGAEEDSLMVVDGLPGLGKTTALRRWAVQNQAIYVRACTEWTPMWFLSDLLGQLRVAPAHSFEKRFRQTLEEVLLRQNEASLRERPFAVVVDEADHISRNRRIMETIRDLSDSAQLTVVLVGMGRIRDNLERFPQITSRVGQWVRFEPATLSDTAQFLRTLGDVPIADDLVAFVHKTTGGFSRETKEALASIERFGKRNGATEAAPVTLAAMAGQHLVDTRKGTPVHVPGQPA